MTNAVVHVERIGPDPDRLRASYAAPRGGRTTLTDGRRVADPATGLPSDRPESRATQDAVMSPRRRRHAPARTSNACSNSRRIASPPRRRQSRTTAFQPDTGARPSSTSLIALVAAVPMAGPLVEFVGEYSP